MKCLSVLPTGWAEAVSDAYRRSAVARAIVFINGVFIGLDARFATHLHIRDMHNCNIISGEGSIEKSFSMGCFKNGEWKVQEGKE